jgi:hypothetical protein
MGKRWWYRTLLKKRPATIAHPLERGSCLRAAPVPHVTSDRGDDDGHGDGELWTAASAMQETSRSELD